MGDSQGAHLDVLLRNGALLPLGHLVALDLQLGELLWMWVTSNEEHAPRPSELPKETDQKFQGIPEGTA